MVQEGLGPAGQILNHDKMVRCTGRNVKSESHGLKVAPFHKNLNMTAYDATVSALPPPALHEIPPSYLNTDPVVAPCHITR